MSDEAGETNLGGRPSKYADSYPDQAEKLARLGLTDAEMADYFEVSEQTINNWKARYPGFFESIKRGKVFSDADVADKLYHRAIGAEWEEEQAIKIKTVEYDTKTKVRTETERIEVISLKKAAPADTTAAIFWLKNRQPDKWRDKQQVEQATSVTFLGEQEALDKIYGQRQPGELPRSGPAGGMPSGPDREVPGHRDDPATEAAGG
jgi:transposase